MLDSDIFEVDRRALLFGTMGLAASAFLWGCAKDEQQITLSTAQMKILSQVCDRVIPRTDTPGAVDVGVHTFVAIAFAHGLAGTGDPESPSAPPENDYGAWLEKSIGNDPAATLPRIDAAAFAEGSPPSPWKTIKGLILTGYFTSEAGATKALRYELIPGRFDPDLPLDPAAKSWASDWTAVDFG